MDLSRHSVDFAHPTGTVSWLEQEVDSAESEGKSLATDVEIRKSAGRRHHRERQDFLAKSTVKRASVGGGHESQTKWHLDRQTTTAKATATRTEWQTMYDDGVH